MQQKSNGKSISFFNEKIYGHIGETDSNGLGSSEIYNLRLGNGAAVEAYNSINKSLSRPNTLTYIEVLIPVLQYVFLIIEFAGHIVNNDVRNILMK